PRVRVRSRAHAPPRGRGDASCGGDRPRRDRRRTLDGAADRGAAKRPLPGVLGGPDPRAAIAPRPAAAAAARRPEPRRACCRHAPARALGRGRRDGRANAPPPVPRSRRRRAGGGVPGARRAREREGRPPSRVAARRPRLVRSYPRGESPRAARQRRERRGHRTAARQPHLVGEAGGEGNARRPRPGGAAAAAAHARPRRRVRTQQLRGGAPEPRPDRPAPGRLRHRRPGHARREPRPARQDRGGRRLSCRERRRRRSRHARRRCRGRGEATRRLDVRGRLMTQTLHWLVVFCLSYLAVVFVCDVALLAVSALENGRRVRQRRAESLDALFVSGEVLPVSVIVPVYNEEAVVVPVVRSLLGLDYPQHEVILVNDGSTDGTLALLEREFALERRAMFSQQAFSRGDDPVTYRSRTDPRLVVVDSPVNGGSKAHALNLALDFCRYPYVCGVDGDTIYDRRALIKAMAPVHRDPARVVGVTSRIGVSTHPENHADGADGSGPAADMSFLGAFQHLEYLRSFLNDRLAWSRLGFMLCTSGAFMLYRRDVIDEVGGFSPAFSCEDIEITFRIHEHLLRTRRKYRIVALPDKVATTEGPASAQALV